MNAKDLIRAQYKQMRDAMPETERLERSRRLCRLLFASQAYIETTEVFTFIGFGSEVATCLIIERALQDGKRVAVPVTKANGQMDFIGITDLRDLRPSRFGVLEPMGGVVVRPDARCLMLLPGLAFGRDGYRVGYGKGFYDRYLSHTAIEQTVGLCFAAQITDAVPHDTFDIAAKQILTEEGWVEMYDRA